MIIIVSVPETASGSIRTVPRDNPTFIMSDRGKPLTPEGFTNRFRKMVVEAGLPGGLSPHGLRKATCRRLAEAGCSAHEIMAIGGHQTLAEVTRYTVAANRLHLAERAVAAPDRKEARPQPVNPDSGSAKTAPKGIDFTACELEMVGDPGIEPGVGLPGGVTVRS